MSFPFVHGCSVFDWWRSIHDAASALNRLRLYEHCLMQVINKIHGNSPEEQSHRITTAHSMTDCWLLKNYALILEIIYTTVTEISWCMNSLTWLVTRIYLDYFDNPFIMQFWSLVPLVVRFPYYFNARLQQMTDMWITF